MSDMKKITRVKNAIKEGVFTYTKLDKKDKILQGSKGLIRLLSGIKYRLGKHFGKDRLNLHKEVAFEMVCAIDRFDFDAGAGTDFGIRITIPAAQNLGIKAGDEIMIMSGTSVLYKQNYKVIDVANVGNVAAGSAEMISATVLRLADISGFVAEPSVIVRAEIQTGQRL